jgi:hypothetical protein
VVGSYSITPSLVDSGNKLNNYAVTVSPGVLTVNRAPLNVSAADAVRGYGSPNPAFTGTITGLQNGGDHITASYSTAATQASPAGSYGIVPHLIDPDGKVPNYSVALNFGTLTIVPAGVTSIAIANHRAQIIGSGQAGVVYVIQASTDLVNWQELGTAMAAANGSLLFEDSSTSSLPARFYRALPR